MFEEYEGSTLLEGLAAAVDLPLDQVNFFAAQLVALLLAVVYRKGFHPSVTIHGLRHCYGLAVGIALIYFCYGLHTLHLFVMSTMCFILLKVVSPRTVHIYVLVGSLTYLSLMHVWRVYYSYGSNKIDVSGPLMVLTQKVSSLAFSIYDGATKSEADMTEAQKRFALPKVPTALEYYSYMFQFPTVLAGPTVYYKDYLQFIEGTDQPPNLNPTKTVFKKVLVALSCCLVFILLNPHFPIRRIKDEHFLETTDFSYKLYYLAMCTNLVRFKYYFAWIMADAICNNAGLGYNGQDPDDNPKWDKVSNVDIAKFEFAPSLKDAIEAWNKGTNIWLRFVVYERAPRFKVFLTYALSALWHGFYPGYYITFFTGAIFTVAARIVRKNVRYYFLENAEMKMFYDVLTFVVTRFVMAYVTFPFVLYEFWASVALYNKLFWHLHLAAILTIVLVPNCLPRSYAANPAKKEENVNIVRVLRSGSYRID